MPDELFNALLAALSPADLKAVLHIIICHTLGYERCGDHISASQIAYGIMKRDSKRVDSGTECDISTVRRSIQRSEANGIITMTRRKADNGGPAVNCSLRWADPGEGQLPYART